MPSSLADFDDPPPCEKCGHPPSDVSPVSWAPAFGEYLCVNCRVGKTDVVLAETRRANLVAKGHLT